ncbi:MAG: hypothetical protein K2K38_04955 [Clostridia bacterium]|nr:hypothetical protein [Clostridia bacterium]
MAQVQLFKKVGKYTDKDGKEKTSTRFYVKCNDTLVPVEVPYFEGKDGERDYQYSNRKAVLTAFADNLPDKDKPEDKPNSAPETTSN